ncbi:MAG: extracellular solute-binding protein [Clostridiales bacterium]|nr:extracellular solute-binding protein [Clostridiales bacterium]
MRKKYLVGFLLAVALGATVIGCGKGNKTAEPAGEEAAAEETTGDETAEEDSQKEEGVIELSIWADTASYDLLNKMIESFKEEYKDEAEFEITLVENTDDVTRDKLLGDIHGGADVFSFADDQLAAMVAGGALAPVDNQDEVRAANLEGAVDAASVNGTIYAYPMTADNGYFLYYNKEYLSEEDVKTLDGILDVAEKANKKFSMQWASGWFLYSFFGNTGLEFGLNEDGVTNYCTWNATDGSIKGVDVAQALLDISKRKGFTSTMDGEVIEKIKSGEVVACISGVWNEVEIRKVWGDDYGAVKLPTYTVADQQVQMASFTGYKMLGVNYYSAHKDWALKLADWLTNEENQKLRLIERSQGPSNIKAAESEEMKNVPALQAVIDQAEYGVLQRVGNNYWAPSEAFGIKMAEGNPDKKDLQELMDELVADITASTVQ